MYGPGLFRLRTTRAADCSIEHSLRPYDLDTILVMHRTLVNGAVVAAWGIGLGTIAWSTSLASSGAWTLLLAVGLLPPILLIRLSKQQEKTISEHIQEALR